MWRREHTMEKQHWMNNCALWLRGKNETMEASLSLWAILSPSKSWECQEGGERSHFKLQTRTHVSLAAHRKNVSLFIKSSESSDQSESVSYELRFFLYLFGFHPQISAHIFDRLSFQPFHNIPLILVSFWVTAKQSSHIPAGTLAQSLFAGKIFFWINKSF